ncbi:hypothetical protein P2318_34320 [Myxococcaceae bacterium GXIMD 01537]
MGFVQKNEARGPKRGAGWLPLLLLLAMVGCAPKATSVYARESALLAHADDFGMLLLGAGLRAEPLLSDGDLTVDEAHRLRLLLGLESAEGGLARYGPRLVANHLLSEVVSLQQTVSRSELNARLQRFTGLAVLRPDGYLVQALTGTPLQCAGPVEVRDGEVHAAEFTLGRFYSARNGTYQEDSSVPRPPRSATYNGFVVTVDSP